MLVLERKLGEEVVIDGEIIVKVETVNKNGVGLLINRLDGHVITLNNKIHQNFSVPLGVGKSTTLNGNTVITLTDVKNNKVYLGFDAPKSVIINRKERNG